MKLMILGGTSGIGLALARHYLEQGDTVAVCGRDIRRLEGTAVQGRPRLQVYALDIADPQALEAAMADFASDRLDLLIVTAGMYFNTRTHPMDAATTLRLLQTNVSGLSHAFEFAASRMLRQGSGQLVAVASVAGLLKDYPGASVYSASKRSVLSLCQTYRMALAPFGIAVTAIVPGYMDTAKLRALNGGDASHKPFLLSERDAAIRIVHAITRRDAVTVFPWQMRWAIAVLNWLPLWPLLRRVLPKGQTRTGT
ncbi:SDR family NAD(P)-dependent oxidoreductase [uncultured Rhodoferax sp.]|uniref:SDR family NAD(P)-dependent oxidoreductase n=1 Tax=uncultured Rhodoferax sp. TaxID=223188 RepID=UPI0025E25F56|nr:SDR family NAD(P)-dependent oxidoreductase [uncultured Rhodoferax sp.]